MGKLFRQYHRVKHELWSSGMVSNLLELNQSLLSDYLSAYVHHVAKRPVSQEEWQQLIAPTELSYIQKEEVAFFRLAKKIQNHPAFVRPASDMNRIKIIFGHNNKLQRIFSQHVAAYCWTQYGWMGPALSEKYFVTRLRGILKKKNAAQQLAKIVKDHTTLIRQQKRSETAIIFDAKHKRLLHLLRRLLFDKTLRVDALYQGYYAIGPHLQELATRTGISLQTLYALHGDEVTAVFRGRKIPTKELRRAQTYSALVKEHGKLIFYTGHTARRKTQAAVEALRDIKAVHELKGQVACSGYVVGTVRIVFSSKDMPKVETGDILVSTATDPSILPAMQKASAFVTDMGGLTAHAAIVARELHKPCIVGTRIATKIFKDGDRVEVDANNGIVRKI